MNLIQPFGVFFKCCPAEHQKTEYLYYMSSDYINYKGDKLQGTFSDENEAKLLVEKRNNELTDFEVSILNMEYYVMDMKKAKICSVLDVPESLINIIEE